MCGSPCPCVCTWVPLCACLEACFVGIHLCVQVGSVCTRVCMPECACTRVDLTVHTLTRKFYQGKRHGGGARGGWQIQRAKGRRAEWEGVAPLGVSLVGPNHGPFGDL